MTNRTAKVSIIGAGAVGATLAQRVAEDGMADVVLLDVAKNMAIAKSLDISDSAPILGHERTVLGTDSFESISSSDIVVITAGLSRKPGMTREDLVMKNAEIVKGVSDNIKKYASSSIVIVVTNPLDTMTYLAYKMCGFVRARVFGMAGVLDGSRLTALIAEELKVPRSSVETCVMGSHGDTMVAVLSKTLVNGRNVSEMLPPQKLDMIVQRTKDRGAEIVGLLGTGSAYYSPSAAVFKMLRAILNNTGETMVVSSYLEGEYGLRDICIGVPCKIGREGIDKVVEIGLSDDERRSLSKSAQAIKGAIALI